MLTLAYQRTVLGTLLQATLARDSGVRLAKSGMATLIDYASRPDASVNTLDQATSARLAVTPVSLRDAPWTVGPDCARARPRSTLCSSIECIKRDGQIHVEFNA